MSKKFIATSLVFAAVAAGLATATTDRRDFKDLAARTAIADEAAKPGSRCPLSKAYVDSLGLDLLSICLAYGWPALDAAQRYPELAPKVFALYGDDPTFRSVFNRFGHPAIAAVGYYLENRSTQYRVSQAFNGAISQIWQRELPKWRDSLTDEQMGLMAVHELDERGSELLAEFEITGGRAKRKPIAASVLGAKNFFLGGIHNVETVWVRGERPLTWKDLGGAALDIAAIAGGVGLLAKEARAADGVASRASPRVIAVNAYRTLRTVGTIAMGPVGNLAILYVLATHPTLLGSAVGWAAEQLGLDPAICIFFAYFLLFRMLLWVFRPGLWLISQNVRLAVRGMAAYKSERAATTG
jgi:hypothetical protein